MTDPIKALAERTAKEFVYGGLPDASNHMRKFPDSGRARRAQRAAVLIESALREATAELVEGCRREDDDRTQPDYCAICDTIWPEHVEGCIVARYSPNAKET